MADVFFIALKIPNFFRRIFAEGAFSQSFIPLYKEHLVNHGNVEAQRFANHIFYFFLISLTLFVILFEFFAPEIMQLFAPGFKNNEAKFFYLVVLSRITFPYIFLIAIATFINSVLNSHKIFIPGSLLPIIFNLSLIFSLFTLGSFTYRDDVSLSVGVLIAGVLQLLFMFVICYKYRIKIYPKRSSQNLRKFWSRFVPSLFASGVIQLNSWVDTIIASLITGAVSYIYYSDRLVQLPLATIGIALSVSILPNLAEFLQKGEKNEAQKIMHNSIYLAMVFSIPAMIGLFLLSEEIIITLFYRGAFNMEAVLATSKMLKCYSFAVPAYVLIKILLSYFYAAGDTKTPVKILIIILISNLSLNLLLIQYYSYLGIAIATVLSSWLNVFILSFILHKKHNLSFGLLQKYKAVFLHSLILIIIISLIKNFFNFSDYYIFQQILSLLFLIIVSSVFYIRFIFIEIRRLK